MRAQMELIGLAFVVVFVILAIMIYAMLSASSPDKLPAKKIQEAETYAKALQTAMLETRVPSCQMSLKRAIITCAENKNLPCGSDKVCVAAYDGWSNMLTATLGDEWSTSDLINHHATVLQGSGEPLEVFGMLGTNFTHAPDLDACAPETLGYAAPEQPLPTSGPPLLFVLKLCP